MTHVLLQSLRICQENEVGHHAGVVRLVCARALLHVCSPQRQGGFCKSYYCSSTSGVSCRWRNTIHPYRPSIRASCPSVCLSAPQAGPSALPFGCHGFTQASCPLCLEGQSTDGGSRFHSFRSEDFNAKSRVSSECRWNVSCELTSDTEAAPSSPAAREGLAPNLGRCADNCGILHDAFCRGVFLPAVIFFCLYCPLLQPMYFQKYSNISSSLHTRLIRR